jgi:hypothetical protein
MLGKMIYSGTREEYIYVTPPIKIQAIKENRDLLIAGYVGFFKTYYNIRQSFF